MSSTTSKRQSHPITSGSITKHLNQQFSSIFSHYTFHRRALLFITPLKKKLSQCLVINLVDCSFKKSYDLNLSIVEALLLKALTETRAGPNLSGKPARQGVMHVKLYYDFSVKEKKKLRLKHSKVNVSV